ncbi:hypothetical protein RZS08_50715, partial [Arthrospira platensis SPKY1]|nr:hypothetical protein [Arthrospira platensis SPKY1]
ATGKLKRYRIQPVDDEFAGLHGDAFGRSYSKYFVEDPNGQYYLNVQQSVELDTFGKDELFEQLRVNNADAVLTKDRNGNPVYQIFDDAQVVDAFTMETVGPRMVG